jgi:hypothetical protein
MTHCALLRGFPLLSRLHLPANDLIETTICLGKSLIALLDLLAQSTETIILSGRAALGLLPAILRLSILLGLRGYVGRAIVCLRLVGLRIGIIDSIVLNVLVNLRIGSVKLVVQFRVAISHLQRTP